jgi:ubiquinol oxidase
MVRADEAHHRDVNHGFASTLSGTAIDQLPVAPYPPHANEIRMHA